MLMFLATTFSFKGQIANYVNNGGFENVITGTNPPEAKFWKAIDSVKYFGNTLSAILPPFQVPVNGYGYQWPRSGNNYFIYTSFYPPPGSNVRGYPLNRLKGNLIKDSTYCVKFYCNITNQSTHGIDAIGAYFGSAQVDTITYCTQALNYLTPQVQNLTGSLITDTLHWVPITGTFVANGNEKYLIIGNFKANPATNSVLINPANLPDIFCDFLIDDVSCIDINLPAFAGNDISIASGTSGFIGREPDIGIDEACIWYKYPDMVNAIDTVAGLWVSPVVTTTYVVKQQIWCGTEKWDTVVVYMDLVGLEKLKVLNENLNLYPSPASDLVVLSMENESMFSDFNKLLIYNSIGQLIREEEVTFNTRDIKINISEFPEGVYSLKLRNSNSETIDKRFVISK